MRSETLIASEVTISAEAAALLEFTSDTGSSRKSGQLTYITSKSAYVWAGVAASIARAQKLKDTRIEDIDIHAAIYTTVAQRQRFVKYNSELVPRIYDGKLYLQIMEGADESTLCYQIVRDILRKLELIATDDDGVNVGHEISSVINSGYFELLRDDLVSDPVIETTLGLAILSALPFSFVKRTRKGQLEYKKIQAAAWKYEWSRKSGGEVQMNLTFEAARIAKALKVGIVAAYHQATNGESDEPDEPLPDSAT
jgi:hypothetical protein